MAGLRLSPDGLRDQYNNPIEETNRLPVDAKISGPLTAFGELLTASKTPVVQIDAINGLRSRYVLARTGGAGTAGDDDEGSFTCSSGTTIGGFGEVASRRKIRYRPGQGAEAEFTALFDTPTDGTEQFAGLFNETTALAFGHDGGSELGVLHRTGGEVHNETLTVNTPSGGETITLTLNGIAYLIPLTSVGNAYESAFEIESWINDPLNNVPWHAAATGAVICLLGLSAGLRNGTYSVTGTGTFVGALTIVRAGVACIDVWVPQTDWNIDPMDGHGPSGMTLDPKQGNVYKIALQYLGYGGIMFSVEVQETAGWQDVHLFKFAGSRTLPTLRQPSFSLGWGALSTTSATSVTVVGVSAMGANQGQVVALADPEGVDSTVAGVSGTLTSIVAIRVRHAFRGRALQNEVLPLFASAAIEGSKNGHVHLLKNPTFATAPNWQFYDVDNSYVESVTEGLIIDDEGELITSSILAGGSNGAINVAEFGMTLQASDVLCIAVSISGPGGDVDASLTWRDD